MSICNVEVVKMVGKYLNVPVGTVCYNTEKVLTTVLNKQSIEGFATIIMHLVAQSGVKMSQEQSLLCYQWLEHISMYGNQAAANPAFAKSFLQERLSILERESLLHLCRWSKHVQAQPKVCISRPPLPLNTLTLTLLAPAVH
ncbi:hypothetical protein MSG28_008770 [Choristoneura fumiferana]|uniref:Uncharacterized protein n=3 Tax=Choristoneura fumiferana TaxID=7141 RepID=A0ACC0J887_CHOFU|nr:hypothetical protein MSG28_008770 [Choristoneura fumiferana]KAI8420226.1 hypothetical protein MSG28_008770 [Choristoneura fumiferana]KAI8420227.1 hypothetical protein MSG28_008770 [Choristoneura fumiferana]